jgi:hypothetical protein
VIKNLFRRHPKFSACRRDLQPSLLILIVFFGEVPGAHENDVTVVGKLHAREREGLTYQSCLPLLSEPNRLGSEAEIANDLSAPISNCRGSHPVHLDPVNFRRRTNHICIKTAPVAGNDYA